MSLLDIRNLSITITTDHGTIEICKNLDITLNEGEIYGLIGSSSSGKSIIAKAIIGMYGNNMKVKADRFVFLDKDITNLSIHEKRKFIGSYVSIILENAKSSLNPNKTIGSQMCESIPSSSFHDKWYKWPFWRKRLVNMLLHKVGIKNTKKLLNSYPHELSEILCQKVIIATALGRKPKLLIADDPTRSMTSISQVQILHLIDSFNKNNQATILYIANDLGSVANIMDKIMMFYCGHIVEYGPTESIIKYPHHPFTKSMLDAIPNYTKESHFKAPIDVLKGNVPEFNNMPIGCKLGPRCPYADSECNKFPPITKSKNRFYCCHFPLNKDQE